MPWQGSEEEADIFRHIFIKFLLQRGGILLTKYNLASWRQIGVLFLDLRGVLVHL